MKKSYKEIEVFVWNFDKDVTTNFIKTSGESFESGDFYGNDEFGFLIAQ